MLKKLLVSACIAMLLACTSSSPLVHSNSEPHGILDFRNPPRPQFSPARLIVLDGQNINQARPTYRVRPGEHEIVIVASINTATGISGSARNQGQGKVTITVEQGRRYRIAAEATGARADQWRPVIWAEEDM